MLGIVHLFFSGVQQTTADECVSTIAHDACFGFSLRYFYLFF